jgi:imidazolonepropionase-like amidohydrolase
MHAIRATHAFDGERFLPGGATVIIDGDTIAGVEPGRRNLPADIEISDYEGTVLPGLFDCHTHLVADATIGGLERAGTMSPDDLDEVILASLQDHARAGVTTVRDLGDHGFAALDFRERPDLPRVLAAGPPLTSPGGHCHFLGAEVTGDPRAAVEEHVRHGVDVIKVMASGGFATPGSDQTGAQFTAPEIRTMADAAHRAGLPLVAHAHSLLAARNALDAGADGIEHFTCLSPDGTDVDDDLLDDVARRGVAICLTLGNDRSLHHLLPDPPPPPLAVLMARMGVATFDELYTTQLAFLSRLRKHGVLVLAGVDSGMAPTKRHGNAWRTVCEQVEAGYPVAEALANATSRAAQACQLQDHTGRLATGLAADLLVVTGDLTMNITALATPATVLLRGNPVRTTAP